MFNDDVLGWIEVQTQHIDLVKSWEAICQTYSYMQFTDNITDATRIEETKWIVREINRFLTAIRKKLITCQDMGAIQEVLSQNFIPTGKVNLDSRKAIIFQKYKQNWIEMMLKESMEMAMKMAEEEKGTEDGWRDFADESDW